MKALVLEQPGSFRLADVDEPGKPAAGEALVRVHRVGICGTDLHAFEGKQTFFSYPRILGHELAVEIVALGENTDGFAVGDCCAVEPYLNCGGCIACRRGKTNCCQNLRVLGVHIDGGMRDRIVVPVNKLHRSGKLTPDQLAIVEPLCVGAHAVSRAALEPGESVLVIGAGPIGLSVIEAARSQQANVAVLEISPRRLEFCSRKMRITQCVDGSRDPAPEIQKIFSGELPTAVFDCTGSPRSMMAAFGYPAAGGRLIFVGHFPGDITFHDPDFHKRELTLLATRNATAADFRRVIQALEDGRIDVTPWITERFQPSAVPGNFTSWLNPETGLLKPIVQW